MPYDAKGQKNNHWKGGRQVDSWFGYILINKPEHPFSTKGYVREHRLVMEKKIGRYLRKDEVVHHINGNRQDNRIENLQLMTRSEHIRHHNRLRHIVKGLESRNADMTLSHIK